MSAVQQNRTTHGSYNVHLYPQLVRLTTPLSYYYSAQWTKYNHFLTLSASVPTYRPW